ncbi:hypothetical protein QUA40_07995 [Microcoleus sp. Pol11C3]|uniref:hypothetical protein n=1 Tax=Microcoleus sp. Pol11C3 TaxID=3055390 RepID=UPI002FD40F49
MILTPTLLWLLAGSLLCLAELFLPTAFVAFLMGLSAFAVAVNSAKGKAQAQVLDAEARQKATILEAEAQQKAIVLKAQAERQSQVLKAQATSEALQIIGKTLQNDPNAREALQFLLAQNYLDMGLKIGTSDSSKVMFMDPRSIPATMEGLRSIVGEGSKAD